MYNIQHMITTSILKLTTYHSDRSHVLHRYQMLRAHRVRRTKNTSNRSSKMNLY